MIELLQPAVSPLLPVDVDLSSSAATKKEIKSRRRRLRELFNSGGLSHQFTKSIALWSYSERALFPPVISFEGPSHIGTPGFPAVFSFLYHELAPPRRASIIIFSVRNGQVPSDNDRAIRRNGIMNMELLSFVLAPNFKGGFHRLGHELHPTLHQSISFVIRSCLELHRLLYHSLCRMTAIYESLKVFRWTEKLQLTRAMYDSVFALLSIQS